MKFAQNTYWFLRSKLYNIQIKLLLAIIAYGSVLWSFSVCNAEDSLTCVQGERKIAVDVSRPKIGTTVSAMAHVFVF